jgi:hypothetical protein
MQWYPTCRPPFTSAAAFAREARRMTPAQHRGNPEIQASGRHEVRFSIYCCKSATTELAQLLVTSKLRDDPAAMVNSGCHIRVSLISILPCFSRSPLRAVVSWRVALYATPPKMVRGRRLIGGKQKSGKPYPWGSRRTLLRAAHLNH